MLRTSATQRRFSIQGEDVNVTSALLHERYSLPRITLFSVVQRQLTIPGTQILQLTKGWSRAVSCKVILGVDLCLKMLVIPAPAGLTGV